MNFSELTINDLHGGLKRKEYSARELAEYFLEKIDKNDKDVLSFLTVSEELAFNQAKEADDLIKKGNDFPVLAGVPCAIKDSILVKNIRCTAGSKILENYTAPYDATCIKKLKSEYCVILGKTNQDEFAMGSSGENSAFGPTRNPRDKERVSGGSSSGSIAAVAAGFAPYSLGSDTGGSIRFPASLCGVVGLKPTYGAVSRYGLIAMASSLDQIGPVAKTVEDAETVFKVISGRDPLDSTSSSCDFYEHKANISDLKIGIPREYFTGGMDKKTEETIKDAIKKFEKEGAKIEEISLPYSPYALAVYYIIMPAEASANLARYDGIKYGYSEGGAAEDLLDVYLGSREAGFGKEVRRRIMLGTYTLSAGYYDAYYLRAQKVRTLIKRDFEKAFKKVDVIMTPVSPTQAFKFGEKADPLTMYLSDLFTVAVNLAGLPAISVPCKMQGSELPVGLQIIGKPFDESLIFETGKVFEKIR